MILGKNSKSRSSVLETYSLYFVIAWTIIVGGFLLFGILQIRHIQQEMVKNEARANFNKDQALRFWSTTHGGVYVPVTDKTPPNPYLSHIKGRDIETPDGKALTLMNPAYMLRETMEKYESLYGIRGHITSLQYFRPETAPDEWEKSALREFERGAKEISKYTEIDGKPYYRYMSPMITKKGCLKCHGHQGYKVGDVRGGVSISVPMTPYLINQQRQTITLAVSLGLLWILGFTGLVWAKRRLKNRTRERDRAETELQKAHDALEQRVEERTAELTHEIEKRKSSEEALEKSETFLNATGQMAKVGGWEINAETHEVSWTAETFRIHEVPQGARPSLDESINFFHSEDRPKLERAIQRALDHGEPYDMDIRFITAKGKHLWTHTRCVPQVVDGRTAKLTGVFQDITEQKRNEKVLQESEGRYRNIFENIQDVYYEATMEGIILEISPSIENVSEYKRKELIGKSLYDIYTNPEERDELIKAILDLGKVANFEVHLTDKDGSQHSVELNTRLHRDQKGIPIKLIGSMRDISERKQLETQLQQAQKMEAIGSLAGGIAHEFNNILTTIIGNTELAIGDIPKRNPARECLEEIQSASLRAKDVVRQLLGFARKSVFQLQAVHLGPVIREGMILIRASTPATIEIRESISCESDTVMADSSQINLVLLNLCANAKNAMQEEGGVLEVKLENTTLDEKSAARYEGLGPGNYVKMTVRDTGHGIEPKIIDRIFEPYFTTSGMAEATGMGLAVVHGIVKRHNGAIIVESEPGKGTVFEVLFPLTEAKEEQKSEKPEVLPAQAERILFVDDEASLVKMAKRILEMQGYQFEAKSDPVEALELFRSKPDRFDLIITDMTMPKMTGDRLAKEILSIRPDMPIILCSGFSEKIDAEKARALGIRKYIEKPMDMSDFVASIRKMLDK